MRSKQTLRRRMSVHKLYRKRKLHKNQKIRSYDLQSQKIEANSRREQLISKLNKDLGLQHDSLRRYLSGGQIDDFDFEVLIKNLK